MAPASGEGVPGQVPSDATEFLIVRHGETTWNAEGRLQGQMEADLNSTGKLQAVAVAERLTAGDLPFAAIYSSDLRRAFDTAVEIAKRTPGMEAVPVEGLRERHLGHLQGLTKDEAKLAQPKAYQALVSPLSYVSIPGGGESIDALHDRVTQTLEAMAVKHPGERVVVVSHGGVINALHERATQRPPPKRVVNASINTIRISRGCNWTVEAWGDVGHLEGVGFQAQAFGGGEDSG